MRRKGHRCPITYNAIPATYTGYTIHRMGPLGRELHSFYLTLDGAGGDQYDLIDAYTNLIQFLEDAEKYGIAKTEVSRLFCGDLEEARAFYRGLCHALKNFRMTILSSWDLPASQRAIQRSHALVVSELELLRRTMIESEA